MDTPNTQNNTSRMQESRKLNKNGNASNNWRQRYFLPVPV